MPLVTVVIPSYNRWHALQLAVHSATNQAFEDFRVLVVDDGSSDQTKEKLEELRHPKIDVLQNATNLGIANSLNRAISESDSKYIARLDSDDQMVQGRLSEQVFFLESNRNVGVLGTSVGFRGLGKKRSWKPPSAHSEIMIRMCFENALAHPSVMIRREALPDNEAVYRENYLSSEDWDLWERISETWQLRNLRRCYTLATLHSEQHSRTSILESKISQQEIMDRFRRRLPIDLPEGPSEITATFITRVLSTGWNSSTPPRRMDLLRGLPISSWLRFFLKRIWKSTIGREIRPDWFGGKSG